MKGKKGSVTLYIVFIITAIIIVVVAAVLAPMGVLFTSKMYVAGEGILNQSLPIINDISDPDVKTSVLGVVQSAKDATVDDISVTSGLFQYSWIFIIVLAGLVIFLFSRRMVEYGGLT